MHFHFNMSQHNLFSFWFLLWPIGCLEMCCLVSIYLKIYSLSFGRLLISCHCGQRRYDVISVFFNLLRLVLWPILWSLLENVHVHLRMYILLLDGMFYICLLGPFVLQCGSTPVCPWFSVCTISPLLIVGYRSLLLLLYCCIFLPWDLLQVCFLLLLLIFSLCLWFLTVLL